MEAKAFAAAAPHPRAVHLHALVLDSAQADAQMTAAGMDIWRAVRIREDGLRLALDTSRIRRAWVPVRHDGARRHARELYVPLLPSRGMRKMVAHGDALGSAGGRIADCLLRASGA